MKNVTNKFTLSKAVKAMMLAVAGSVASVGVHADAALSCEIQRSGLYKRVFVLHDVVVENAGNLSAGDFSLELAFDRDIDIERTWGDVAGANKTGSRTIRVEPAGNGLAAGQTLDFGLKGNSDGRVSAVSCTVINGASPPPTSPPEPTPPIVPTPSPTTAPTPVATPTPMPTRAPSPTPQPPVSEKCPTSNSGALLVQNFESFSLGTPAMRDEKAFKKEFCTPLYTVAGFGAEDEISNDEKARGRARAGQKAGAQDFVRLSVVDGADAFAGKSLKVMYPNGGNTSSHSGVQYPEYIPGTPAYDRDSGTFQGANRYQEMYVSYWIKFEDDFSWQLGGKLPGMIAERGYRDPNRDERVNTRLMWREEGKLEFYIHSPYLKDKTAGRAYEDRIFWDNGRDFTGHARLTKGKWHHIEFRMKLNDVINGNVIPNGELEGWLDGKHAAFYNDVTLRGDADFNINTFFFSTFFGGSSGNGDKVWWPLKDVYAFFDQIEVSDQRIGCCNRNPN